MPRHEPDSRHASHPTHADAIGLPMGSSNHDRYRSATAGVVGLPQAAPGMSPCRVRARGYLGGHDHCLPGDPARIDPAFAALPLPQLAEAALDPGPGARRRTRRLPRRDRPGAADVALRDGLVDGVSDDADTGLSVRVVHEGTWGFAAGVVLTPESRRAAGRAGRGGGPGVPAASTPSRWRWPPEPVHGARVWVSAYEVNPFDVPDAEKIEHFTAVVPAPAGRTRASTTSTCPSRPCRRTSTSPTWPATG